jgi:hypothetical protein
VWRRVRLGLSWFVMVEAMEGRWDGGGGRLKLGSGELLWLGRFDTP